MKKVALVLALMLALSVGLATLAMADCPGGNPNCTSVSGFYAWGPMETRYHRCTNSGCTVTVWGQAGGVTCSKCYEWYRDGSFRLSHYSHSRSGCTGSIVW